MATTKVKKFPLQFYIQQEPYEVHTIRRTETGSYRTACGQLAFESSRAVIQDEPVQLTCDKCLEAYTERFKWTVEFTVHPTWVADGFDLTEERALEMLANDLQWAHIGSELHAKVISAPDPDEIAMEQGYDNDAQRKAKG